MDHSFFDWDEQNIGHLVRHQISPEEAEQVINNRPVDLEFEVRNGEQRVTQVGETDASVLGPHCNRAFLNGCLSG